MANMPKRGAGTVMMKIGILTSGGDCQGLNASIRGVAKSLYNEFNDDIEIYGIQNGYAGLIYGDIKKMTSQAIYQTDFYTLTEYLKGIYRNSSRL